MCVYLREIFHPRQILLWQRRARRAISVWSPYSTGQVLSHNSLMDARAFTPGSSLEFRNGKASFPSAQHPALRSPPDKPSARPYRTIRSSPQTPLTVQMLPLLPTPFTAPRTIPAQLKHPATWRSELHQTSDAKALPTAHDLPATMATVPSATGAPAICFLRALHVWLAVWLPAE